MIAWVLHILELIAGIFGVGVGISRLPDASSALAVVTPTAVGLVGLLAFVRHFLFHESDAKRLGYMLGRFVVEAHRRALGQAGSEGFDRSAYPGFTSWVRQPTNASRERM